MNPAVTWNESCLCYESCAGLSLDSSVCTAQHVLRAVLVSSCLFGKQFASPSVYCGGGNSRKIISVSVIAHAEARSVREALHEFRHLWGSSGKSCASAEIWRGQYIRMTSHKSDTSNLSPLHLPRLWENGDELLIEGLGLAKNNTYNIKFSQWLVSNRCRLRKPVAINY